MGGHRRTAVAVFAVALLALVSCRSSTNPQDIIGPWDVQRPSGAPSSTLELRLVLDEPVSGSIELPAPEGETLVLAPEAVVTQGDIVKTAIGLSAIPESYAVYVYFTPEAAQRMQEVSRANIGRRMAFVLDGQVFLVAVMHATVNSPILVEDDYSREEATRVAERLAP
ncbi:MAG TPA: hypothetical protein VMW27_06790 [Thermoanaerobaculia bacterium]|nr:hypothetical protein [Thermoanaerobaculia bacterium]